MDGLFFAKKNLMQNLFHPIQYILLIGQVHEKVHTLASPCRPTIEDIISLEKL